MASRIHAERVVFGEGSKQLFEIGRVPVRAHWSVLLGFLIVGGGFRWAPGAWLGYLAVIIAHELGHAALAKSYRLTVFGVEVNGFGGVCFHEPARSAIATSAIAWGGVLAQLALYAGARVVLSSVPDAHHGAWGSFFGTLLTWNLGVAALNLLPFGPFDGARAWQLFPLLYRRARRPRRARPRRVEKGPSRAPRPIDRPRSAEAPNLRLVRGDDGDFRFELDENERENQRRR